MNAELLKQYLFALVGRPYHWGGDDPIQGWDCSGLAGEAMRAIGLLPHGQKQSAQMLYAWLAKMPEVKQAAVPGALAFYGTDTSHVIHVAVCLGGNLMIEAGGGSSDTVNDSVASQRNAFVKMRPILYRRDFLAVLTHPSLMTGAPLA